MRKAYTLIELLVTLSIVGLLFGFGYVSFRDFSRRQALSGSLKKIQGDLRLAQQQALSGKKPNNVKCNPPNRLDSFSFNVYSTSSYKIEANCTGGTPVLISDVTLTSGVSISTPSINPINFKVLGQGTNIPKGASTTVTISQASLGSQLSLTVTDGGEIK
jgi:prepilin-type N-terminal cleavage/methylation domain-containing protein